MASIDVWRSRSRIGLFALFGTAGVLHIGLPEPFVSITPAWVPNAASVILLTGLCEIAGAIGLFVPPFRKYAGAALALYAVLVFPANIKHALDDLTAPAVSPWPWLYHVVRLPLQPFIVWLAVFAVGIVSWPLKDKSPGG
ncbi:DoxX family protein [Ensifer adhaerens]|uniref:DoxX family protein n=1 Tax=Ensifer adhaerens TaxID=106592 RepID=UPI003D029EED